MWPTIAILLVTAVSAPGDGFAPTVVVEQPPLVAGGWDAPPPPEAGGWDNPPPPEAGMCDDGCGCPGPLGGLLAGPCVFDNYWNATGGRSPTDWIQGYGPECHLGTARLEWLMWFSKGRDAPVLTRTITRSGKLVDYPGDPIGGDLRHGARITLGRLLADEVTWVEGRFWGLEDSSETFATDSSHTPIITRPIFDTSAGQQVNAILSAPGLATGNINILSKNDLFGADAWLRRVWWDDGYHRVSFLAGYQFNRLDDSIVIRSAAAFGNGFTLALRDSFRMQNEFHGGSLGLASNWRKHRVSIEALGKVGLGNIHQRAIIDGQSSGTPLGGATTSTPVGFLAQPSNIGTHTRNQFAVVPELNLNAIVHFSPQWQFMAGYSFIYWNNVILAGNEINTHINPNQPPGTVIGQPRPLFSFNRSDFWVQGISLGAEYRW